MTLHRSTRVARLARALLAAVLGLAAIGAAVFVTAVPASAPTLVQITSPANGSIVAPKPYVFSGKTYQIIYVYGTFVPVGKIQTDVMSPVVDGKVLTGFTGEGSSGPFVPSENSGTSFKFPFAVEDFTPVGLTFFGTHTIQFQYRHAPSTAVIATSAPVTLTFVATLPTAAPAPTATAPAAPAAAGAKPAAPSAAAALPQTSRLASGRADAPSFLRAVPTAQSLHLTPTRALVTAIVTVILMLLVGFPGQLIGSTLSANYDRVFGWTKPIAGRLKQATDAVERLPRSAIVAIGVTLASIISGFVDPQFGFNLGSLRVLLEVAVAFLVQNLLGWFVVGRLSSRQYPELKPVIEFKALSLLIVIVAVVISRLTGFEPGIVFGLIVGLNFGAALTATHKARIALTGSAYAFIVAMIGWIGYSITVVAFGAHPNVIQAFVIETLSGFAVAGIATLPISLLPIRSLEGGELFEWKRWVWALSYGIGLFAFLIILLPLPFSWGTVHQPLIVWIALYVAYALAAVGIWAYFRFVRPGRAITADLTESEPETTPTK